MVFQSHFIVKIWEAEPFFLWVTSHPFAKETDAETAEHAQEPDGLTIFDATPIFVGRNVEPLMQTIFDTPVLALEFEPFWRLQMLTTGQHINGFWFSATGLARQFAHLCRSWKTDLFGGYRAGADGAFFITAAILLMSLRGILGRRLRGKRPPVWRSSGFGPFDGCFFDYL